MTNSSIILGHYWDSQEIALESNETNMNSNFAIKRITKLALGHSTSKRSESLERTNPKASATKEKN